MPATPPYLEGLLAAARPGHRPAAAPPSPARPAAPAEPAAMPAGADGNLSREEGIKRHLHPLDSFARLLDCAAANRPPDADDQFRFQWFGLFYQAPGQDAFTLRLRLPGGRLNAFQLAGLADITQRHAGGQVILNAQGGLDLPGVPVTAAVQILRQIAEIGLSALQTGGDCVQSVRGGECDGPGAEACYSLVCALEQALAYSRVCSDLPRGCDLVFQAPGEDSAVRQDPSIDTVVLHSVVDPSPFPDQAPGFGPPASFLLVPPGDPEVGYPLPPSRVVPAILELLKSWAVGADRTTRESAGLARFLARVGPEGTSAVLGEVRRLPLPPRSRLMVPPDEGKPPTGLAVPGGRLLSGQLAALREACRGQGLQEIRLCRGRLHAAGADSDTARVAAALLAGPNDLPPASDG